MTRLIYGFRTRSKTPASWTVRENAHGTQDRTVKAESDGLRAVFEHLTCAHVTRTVPSHHHQRHRLIAPGPHPTAPGRTRTCARNSTLKYLRREYRSGYTASTPGAPPVRRFSFEPTAPAPEIALFPTILSAAGNRDVHVTRPKLLAFSSTVLRARRLFDAVASRC